MSASVSLFANELCGNSGLLDSHYTLDANSPGFIDCKIAVRTMHQGNVAGERHHKGGERTTAGAGVGGFIGHLNDFHFKILFFIE